MDTRKGRRPFFTPGAELRATTRRAEPEPHAFVPNSVIENPDGTQSFTVAWQGMKSDIGKSITFPNGTTREIQYLRGGEIVFTDGTQGVYARITKSPSKSQAIRITWKPPQA